METYHVFTYESRGSFVSDTPVGVGSINDTETYFAALGSQVILSITVHCYPEARFLWQKDGNRISSTTFESLEYDRYRSSVDINDVQGSDYGTYMVTVESGRTSFSKIFSVILQMRGKNTFRAVSLKINSLLIHILTHICSLFKQKHISHISWSCLTNFDCFPYANTFVILTLNTDAESMVALAPPRIEI